MQLNYHYFATAAKLDDVKKGLGSEMDYQLDWNVMKDVKLSARWRQCRPALSLLLLLRSLLHFPKNNSRNTPLNSKSWQPSELHSQNRIFMKITLVLNCCTKKEIIAMRF